MRSLLIITLLVFNLSACKRGENDPESIVAPIVGKWRLVSYQEEQPNGDLVWVETDAETEGQYSFEFGPDGVLLGQNGKLYCCPPSGFYLNGKHFNYVHSDEAGVAPLCILVLCAVCEAWQMELEENTLSVVGCSLSGAKYRYERVE